MTGGREQEPPLRFLGWVVTAAVGLVLVVTALTVLFLGMRDVMEVGGACGSGQSGYEIATECPQGAWAVPVSILAGLIGLGVYAWGASHLPGPRWVTLAWPALFLSLGWNFWEYGLDPPGEPSGAAWGWIACGVLFVLMGGVPLLLALRSSTARRRLFWSDAPAHAPGEKATRVTAAELAARNPGMRLAGRSVEEAFGGRPPPPPAEGSGADDRRLTSDLERLARLHRRGDLSDAEFRAAKARLLDEEVPS